MLEQGQEIKEKDSVGKEFIEWAEQHWNLENIINIENPDKFGGEVCDYQYMRQIFINKINSIIIDRLQ